MSLIAELQRRNVIRFAGLYLVGAWLLVQVAGTVLPMFGAPAWLPRSIVLLLAIGFVPALVFAWVFELTPEGIKRDAEVTAAESIAPQTARRMDRMIIAVLVLALGFFAFDRFVLAPRRDAALVADTQRATKAADGSSAGAGVDRRSVAVLPFVNMSGDAANEYFSDGISEEILNVLAGVPDLKVAARTSSFSFKGKNAEVPAIARELQVRMVLEGSVRKSGDTVRITAQLIDAKTGYHVWSQTYDRKLEDIFAIQDEIAKAIGDELKVKIVDEHRAAGAASTRNPRAHDLYLQGMALWHERGAPGLLRAIALFEQAEREDPGYADAWAGEALTYTILPFFSDAVPRDEAFQRSTARALRALALDPGLAEPYVALANNGGNNIRSIDRPTNIALLRRAIQIRPSFATAHQWLGNALGSNGDAAGALVEQERAAALDPRASIIADNRAIALLMLGRYDDARAVCKPWLDVYGCLENSAFAALAAGDMQAARPLLEALPAVANPSAGGQVQALLSAMEGRGDRHALAVTMAGQAMGSNVQPGSGNAFEDHILASLIVMLGEPGLALDYMERISTVPGNSVDWAIRFPVMDPLRCEPRFRALVTQLRTSDPRARCTP
jgi:TolB-like protein/Tfp pilus assembly protein PilF